MSTDRIFRARCHLITPYEVLDIVTSNSPSPARLTESCHSDLDRRPVVGRVLDFERSADRDRGNRLGVVWRSLFWASSLRSDRFPDGAHDIADLSGMVPCRVQADHARSPHEIHGSAPRHPRDLDDRWLRRRPLLAAADLQSGPIFRSVNRHGCVGGRLTDQSVSDIVKAHAERVGLDPALFAGHSLRAGFLTSAAKRGASIFKMMDVSRHRSVDTLRGYVRDAEIFKDHAGAGLL